MANTPKLVAARYIGDYPVVLSRQHGPVYAPDTVDADGTIVPGARIDGTLIGKGDLVMLPAAEVLGQTYWHDPHQQAPSLYIGVGAVVRPEHAGMTRAALHAIGYDFHEGRSDFEAVSQVPVAPPSPDTLPNFRPPAAPDKPFAAPTVAEGVPQPLSDSVTLANEDVIVIPDAVPDEPAADDAPDESAEEPSVTAEPTSDATDPAQGA